METASTAGRARVLCGAISTMALAVGLLATADARDTSRVPADGSTIVAQFLSRPNRAPDQYRALRRLEARNNRFNAEGWLDAWTEYDSQHGFRFQVIGEGGSRRIRDRALRAILITEQKQAAAGRPLIGDVTRMDYDFLPAAFYEEGLVKLLVKPRRQEGFLVDGAIFVSALDADLVRFEGRLAKNPSFWTRRVDVVRHYGRVGGVQVPLAVESTADVRIAGPSTLTMTYQYESINGRAVRPSR